MTWLVAHMWIALAGAALVALLLGWSLRGMLLLGKLRRAEVDRDVARVELGEAREEIERLFAAQRKLLAEQGGAQSYEASQISPQADPALEQQMAETLAALNAARDELEVLKSAPPVLAPAPEMAAVPVIDAGTLAQTQALEEKAASLEAELAAARRALSEAEVARAEAAAVTPPAGGAQIDPKLSWKAGYLALRVKALENEVAVHSPIAALPAAVSEAPPPAGVAPPSAEAGEEPVEEELARLRWRNRFLEGRLAYFEGDAESVADEIAAEDAADAREDSEEDGEDDPEETAGAYEDLEAEVDVPQDEDEAEDDEAGYAAETILGRLEAEDAMADAEDVVPAQPLALDGPVEGAPDDLTLIGGIGPRIQDVLNSLGIYHYDQIADWSPENIAWIDDYLNFKGRVKREGWVEQAAVLVGEGVEP